MNIRFYLLISFLFLSCKMQMEEPFPVGKWDFSKHHISFQKQDNYSVSPSREKYNSFVRLFPNNKFICVESGKFTYGKWEFDKGILLLKLSTNEAVEMKVLKNTPNSMRVQIEGFDKIKGLKLDFLGFHEIDFTKDSYSPESAADDPYSFENNAWRIRATHPESLLEIKNRVGNHLKFLISLHKQAIDGIQKKVSFDTVVTPLRFIQNGIFFHQPTTEDEYYDKWLFTFYNENDAMTAKKLIKKAMYKTKLHNEIKETVLYNLDILQQMQSNLDKAMEEME